MSRLRVIWDILTGRDREVLEQHGEQIKSLEHRAERIEAWRKTAERMGR